MRNDVTWKIWRYQGGDQKPLKSKKDRQYNDQKKKNKFEFASLCM
jgi:hypothetical protein